MSSLSCDQQRLQPQKLTIKHVAADNAVPESFLMEKSRHALQLPSCLQMPLRPSATLLPRLYYQLVALFLRSKLRQSICQPLRLPTVPETIIRSSSTFFCLALEIEGARVSSSARKSSEASICAARRLGDIVLMDNHTLHVKLVTIIPSILDFRSHNGVGDPSIPDEKVDKEFLHTGISNLAAMDICAAHTQSSMALISTSSLAYSSVEFEAGATIT